LLLPSRLTLEPLGPTQFALRGENAEVIDAVTMQSGTEGKVFPTAPGVDFALVTLPTQSDTAKAPDKPASGDGAGGNSSTQITIDATKDSIGHVKMRTQSSSTPAKAAAAGAKGAATPFDEKTSASKQLAPGSYAVIPLIRVGTTPPDQSKLDAKAKATRDVTNAQANLDKVAEAVKAAPAAASKQKLEDEARTRLANAKTAATKAATEGEPTPIYMPLTVTDEKGKPLIFTIPEPKKPNAAAQAGATPGATCAAPCVVAPCGVACQQAQSQAASPKSQ
jgi:hypothetical protein